MAKTKIPGEYLKDSVVRFTAKAGENITKGQAVYISGISGEVPVVSLADADDTNKMPAFGLAESTVSTNASVEVTSNGTLAGIDTSSYALGDILYISTTAGSLTNDPSGLEASKVQNIGMVQRVHANNGSIKVGGAGRTNATPNLNDGNIFVGNSSNKSVADSFTDVLNDQAGINSSANATAITIDSSENVGIGVTPKAYHSDYKAIDINNSASVMGYTGNNGAWLMENLYYDGNWKHKNSDFSALVEMYDGVFNFYNTVSGTAGATATLQNRLKIDQSGNVGIGADSPTSYYSRSLVVSATAEQGITIAATGTSMSNYLMFADGTTGNEAYRGYIAYSHTNDKMAFAAGGEEKMYIDSSGNVGIGISNPADYNFDTGVNLVVGSSSTNGQIQVLSGTSGIGYLAFADGVTGAENYRGLIQYHHGSNYMGLRTNGNERMRITSTGNLEFKSTTTTFTGASSFTNHSNGVLYLRGGTSGLRLDDNDSHNTIHVSGAGNYIAFETLSGVERWRFNSTGHFTPAQQHTYDIGGVNAEVRNIYAQGLYVGGSAAANKLDDYEEGTWTPVLSGSGYAFGTNSGVYVKVGRMVIATAKLIITSVGSNTSVISISGYPFTSYSANNNHQVGTVRESATTGKFYVCQINVNNTIGSMNSMDGISSGSNEIFTTGTYSLSITYMTA